MDPSYAPAYAGAALAYTEHPWHGLLPAAVAYPEAKRFALRGLELDPDLSRAHVALALVRRLFEWDWADAEESFRRAAELDVNTGTWYANYLTSVGRFEEAIAVARRDLEADPLSADTNRELAFALHFAGRVSEARDQYLKTLELSPNDIMTHRTLGRLYVEQRMCGEALRLNERATVLVGGARSATDLSAIGALYARCGRRIDALKILRELERRARTESVGAYSLAVVHLALGDNERALASLQRAYENREVHLVWLKVHPIFDPLRDDPRFQDLLRRMNFPT